MSDLPAPQDHAGDAVQRDARGSQGVEEDMGTPQLQRGSQGVEEGMETPQLQRGSQGVEEDMGTPQLQRGSQGVEEDMGTPQLQRGSQGVKEGMETPQLQRGSQGVEEGMGTPQLQRGSQGVDEGMETPQLQRGSQGVEEGMETPQLQRGSQGVEEGMGTPQLQRGSQGVDEGMEIPQLQRGSQGVEEGMGTPQLQRGSQGVEEGMETPQLQRGSQGVEEGMETPQLQRGSQGMEEGMGTPQLQRGSQGVDEGMVTPQLQRGSQGVDEGMETPQLQRGSQGVEEGMGTPQLQRGSQGVEEGMETPQLQRGSQGVEEGMGTPQLQRGSQGVEEGMGTPQLQRGSQGVEEGMGTPQPLSKVLQTGDDNSQQENAGVQPHGTKKLCDNAEPLCPMETRQGARDAEEERATTPDWSAIPDVVVVTIMRMLPVMNRLNMAQVCQQWQEAANRLSVWQIFDYGVLCPEDYDYPIILSSKFRMLQAAYQQYLEVIGQYADKFTSVHIVLYSGESVQVLKSLAAHCRNLKYCTVEVFDETPQTLSEVSFADLLSIFLSNNDRMQELRLKNIDFTGNECYSAVPVGNLHSKCLQKLSLINSFRDGNMSQLMYLVNLTELTVAPHHLRVTWLSHLKNSSLRTLNIVGDVEMLQGVDDFRYPSERHWRSAMESAQIKVNCYSVSTQCKLLCPEIPLITLACYDLFEIPIRCISRITKPFSETLTTLVCYAVSEKSMMGRVFRKRSDKDGPLLEVVQKCSLLTTIALPSILYSSTILLMIQLNPNLRDPIVRDDFILYELDIPEDLELSEEVRHFTHRNYSKPMFAAAVSQLLKRKWHPLSKTEYTEVLNKRFFDW